MVKADGGAPVPEVALVRVRAAGLPLVWGTGCSLPATLAGWLSWSGATTAEDGSGLERGVLEGLEAVNWAALGHAYGSAEDVPAWLGALRSPDPEVRQWAHEEWNIVHQGTRYSATAPAVPFLVELATAPGTYDRAWLVNLLAYAAVGHEQAVLPDGLVSLDRLGDTTSWPEPEYAAWALAAYQAVQAALPALLPLLDEDDDRLRGKRRTCWPGFHRLRRSVCPACAAACPLRPSGTPGSR